MNKFFLIFTLFFSSLIYSQTEPINKELREIIVSANKYETSLFNTASSVSVITSEDIKQNQFNTVVDALKECSGFICSSARSNWKIILSIYERCQLKFCFSPCR